MILCFPKILSTLPSTVAKILLVGDRAHPDLLASASVITVTSAPVPTMSDIRSLLARNVILNSSQPPVLYSIVLMHSLSCWPSTGTNSHKDSLESDEVLYAPTALMQPALLAVLVSLLGIPREVPYLIT